MDERKTKTADKVTTNMSQVDSKINQLSQQKDAALAAYKASKYKPSKETTAYQQALKNLGDYKSNYSDQINQTLGELQKGYDMNADPTFQQYKQIYTKSAQDSSRDILARQAALNGGGGSSMAQRQANQAYQNTMSELYNLVPQLSQQWTSNKQALLGAYQNQDQIDYTKYTDNRSFYQNMYLAAQDRDMQLYSTELQKMYNTISAYQSDIDTRISYTEWANEFNRQVEQDGINNAIAWAQQQLNEAQLAENQRQFDANMAEQQRQYNNEYTLNLAKLANEAAVSAEESKSAYNQCETELRNYYNQIYKDAGYGSKTGYSGLEVLKTMKEKIKEWARDGVIDTSSAASLTQYAASLINGK